ncbi:hypothetical protein BH11MYX1_BH11MYX1_46090 [soil metagenome]
MTIFTLVRALHIASGSVALAVFCIPLFARKGGALHSKAGWAFVIAISGVATSAQVMCFIRLTDGDPTNDVGALFLAFISVLSANAAVSGVRAVRRKKRREGSRAFFDVGLSIAQLGFAVGVMAVGISRGSALLMGFAMLGLVSGAIRLAFWWRAPKTPMDWFLEHMSGMGTACIATVTAFAVVNASKVGLSSGAFVVWAIPAALGGIALGRWITSYRQRFLRPRADGARAGQSQQVSPLSARGQWEVPRQDPAGVAMDRRPPCMRCPSLPVRCAAVPNRDANSRWWVSCQSR